MPRPKVIGITGTIASGKSFVGQVLSQKNFLVTDTDEVVHALFDKDSPLVEALVERFGEGITTDAGKIDRPKLGKIVFENESARRDLEQLVHPLVIEACRRIVETNQSQPVLFFLVPLLFEAGLEKNYDEIWTVVASDDVVRKRLKERNDLSDAEVDQRLAAQFPQSEKARRSTHVIDNSGSREQTTKQVEKLLTQLAPTA